MEEIEEILEIKRGVSITKEELASLPTEEYRKPVILIDNPENAEQAVSMLEKHGRIGFDTETKPSFRKGQTHFVALMQLSTPDECYLFRLNKIGFPSRVKSLLENPEIEKIGLSIHDDFHSLNKFAELHPQGFVELQNFVKEYKIVDCSLARIYAILFGKRISKGQRLTNWEAEELSQHQQAYAALDADACVRIYEYLKSGRFIPEESDYYKEILPPANGIKKTADPGFIQSVKGKEMGRNNKTENLRNNKRNLRNPVAHSKGIKGRIRKLRRGVEK